MQKDEGLWARGPLILIAQLEISLFVYSKLGHRSFLGAAVMHMAGVGRG